jgi:hypothetical protein
LATAPAGDEPASTAPVLALLAPFVVETQQPPGTRLTSGAALGKALPGGLGVAVRKLRPNQSLDPGPGVLDEARSSEDDPRNVLPLRTAEHDAP